MVIGEPQMSECQAWPHYKVLERDNIGSGVLVVRLISEKLDVDLKDAMGQGYIQVKGWEGSLEEFQKTIIELLMGVRPA